MKSNHDAALELLEKAENDIIATQATLATGKALDTVCFHAQQAAEKGLKAVLAFHGIEYPFRHDLDELLVLAQPYGVFDEPLTSQVSALTSYAVLTRYTRFNPPIEKATEELAVAVAATSLVRSYISADSVPDTEK
jgi:HEPN domain-containing protein